MRTLLLLLVLLVAPGCVIVRDCNPQNCNGCCTGSGQCQSGSASNACGNGGATCAACPATFTCSLGTCQPGSNLGGGAGGGFGGGAGGGGGGGGGGAGLSPGDVTFLWSFASSTCAQVPGVQSVRIAIPGQTLANSGVFPCTSGGTDGIVLLSFVGASYSYTIEGLGAGNVTLFQGAGGFTVNGNVTVNVNLSPASGSTASALVRWSFPPNGASSTPDCTQAGVSEVLVTLDSGAPQPVACALGFGTFVQVDNLTAGTHAIDLEARDGNGFVYYRKSGSLTAQVGTLLQHSLAFDWAVGSLPLKWTFSNGVTQLTCAQAGVSQVNVNFLDAASNYLYGTTGIEVPCVSGSLQGTDFTYLNGGSYSLFLQAYGTGSVLYRSDFTTPPIVTVVNGQFPVLGGTTPATLMTP